jgi:hypothetical protein
MDSEFSGQLWYNYKQMPSKNTEKKLDSIKELQKDISPILVINNSSLKPYIELFEHTPENIYQKPLGTLIGFFEIKEYSEQSAYVVNFLTSVLKKEYYANPRRSVTESFDSAMHKVNLALSEVAKHGNVEWIGKLHACICVIEKNSIHFTVAGNAKIFLNRKQALTDISEGLSSQESEPHPLKTFVNVSSGRLEKGDKLIITSEDIFHILKLSDLQKNLQRLNKPQFVQFLKTALSNELEMIATIVADFEEVKKSCVVKTLIETEIPFQEEAINVFSEKAFPGKNTPAKSTEENFDLTEENLPQPDYTDKKTGHIYIQGDAPPAEFTPAQHFSAFVSEKISDGWHFTKNTTRRNFTLLKKNLQKQAQQAKAKAAIRKEQQAQDRAEQAKLAEERKIEAESLAQLAKAKEAEALKAETERLVKLTEEKAAKELEIKKTLAENKTTEPEPINKQSPPVAGKKQLAEIINLKEKTAPTELALPIDRPLTLDEKILKFQQQLKTQSTTIPKPAVQPPKQLKNALQKSTATVLSTLQSLKKIKKPSFKLPADLTKKIKQVSSSLLPHFSKFKKIFQALTAKQKFATILALLIIFVAPIFINNWLNRPKPVAVVNLPKIEISLAEKLAGEKNIKFGSTAKQLFSNSKFSSILLAGDSLIASTNASLLVWKNQAQNEYTLPANTGNIVTTTYMADLAMVLILTDQNKLISFTTSNAKFSENNITLSSSSPTKLIGTYLTYLYFLDPASSQIVRYPRADGGFGEKTNWLKETASFIGTSDMTIDDSIYLIQNGQVIKFFKGKKASLTLENSATPVQFTKLFTTIELTSFYALDTQNARLVQYDKTSGNIIAQFYSEAFANGTAFTVDEKAKKAFVVTKEGLSSVDIQ